MRNILLVAALLGLSAAALAGETTPRNRLRNPGFAFHAFENHRSGVANNFASGSVAYWDVDAWGDVLAMRESHVPDDVRPPFSVGVLVRIAPGKTLSQTIFLPEAGLAHGDHVSLSVGGRQAAAGDLRARLRVLKLDSADGTWKPSDFQMKDTREFPKHGRGELVVSAEKEARADTVGTVSLAVENVEIAGHFHRDSPDVSRSEDLNAVAVRVEFSNASAKDPAWVYAPCLVRGEKAVPDALSGEMPTPYYRFLPRTIQKLWKGEAIHILAMGSSIDRGSANPPMYVYDENPASPKFKQPISDDYTFNTASVGHPEWNDYYGWSQHWFSYTGRLRLALMRRFNLPIQKICLNYMACDGSCVGEAHSGLDAYADLAVPPKESENGQKAGKSWRELYPDLFTRPGGPGPDLVIFGSGANEKTDTPDEVAVFEGTIRHLQARYPGVEFLFCMFQNTGEYTPNAGDLQALALRYQIPVLDYGKIGDELTRWCNRYALVPRDGHPQAVAHYLWSKQLESAFQCWDPIVPGLRQLRLPERVHPDTYGWEGDMTTFEESSPRLVGKTKFMFEDMAVNLWCVVEKTDPAVKEDPAKKPSATPYVDGVKLPTTRGGMTRRDLRNSTFRFGRTTLGDRHILEMLPELPGYAVRIVAVDAKTCPERRFFPAGHPLWNRGDLKVEPFASAWGAPCGTESLLLPPGGAVSIDVVGSDASVAYADAADGGVLRVLVDGAERLKTPANVPFVDVEKKSQFMENRKGLRDLGFGWHTIRIEAAEKPVRLLGLYVYDSRSNRDAERRVTGFAAGGETVRFSPSFKTRPFVMTAGGLTVDAKGVTPDAVVFSGTPGTFEVVGE